MPTSTPFVPYYRRFPSGAVWLILLGTFFLLNNVGLFHFFHTRFFVPILLIGLGVWVFVHRMIESGLGLENDDTDFYRWRFARALHSSFWMVLVGVIWLLDALRILRWSHSWPLFLIAAGVLHLFRHALIGESAGYPPQNNGMPPYSNPSAYSAQAAEGSVTPPGEAGREPSANDPGSQTDSHDGSLGNQEGR